MHRAASLLVVLQLVASGCSEDHPCSSALTKGPWVQRVDGRSATMRWESLSRGCAEVALRPEAGGPERLIIGTTARTEVTSAFGVGKVKEPDRAGTFFFNTVTLGELQPGTCYRWRMRGGPGADQLGRFCTAAEPGGTFRFIALGDTNPILARTAPVLKHALTINPDFSIHVGDIQYYSSSETWAYWFGSMAPLLRAGAFFPSIGNHENENDGTEYVDYYERLFTPAGPDATLTRWYRFQNGGVWFFALDTESPLDAGSEQVAWLASALADAQAQPGFRFSVVYFHRPIYTLGDSDPMVNVRRVIEPLFARGGVSLVVQGHMHGYERFEVGNGITYMTCAGGGGIINAPSANLDNYPEDRPLRVAVSEQYSSCTFTVAPGLLSARVIDEFGGTVDAFDKVVP